MLNTDWTEVEVIQLFNDGSGLGFGLMGSKSTGVVVRTIVPGGVADRNGRLHIGDHIIYIDELAVRGMTSEQVATVLRQAGVHVRVVIARPIPGTPQEAANRADREDRADQTSIIPTCDLEEHLEYLANALLPSSKSNESYEYVEDDEGLRVPHNRPVIVDDSIIRAVPVITAPNKKVEQQPRSTETKRRQTNKSNEAIDPRKSSTTKDEIEYYEVVFQRGKKGLGITVAGYVSTTPEVPLHGLFVRSITQGSCADIDGRIRVNDQIVQVNGTSLHGLDNHRAVEILKLAKETVHLRLGRYKHGLIYDQLKQTINAVLPTTPSISKPSQIKGSQTVASSQIKSNQNKTFKVEAHPDQSTTSKRVVRDEPQHRVTQPVKSHQLPLQLANQNQRSQTLPHPTHSLSQPTFAQKSTSFTSPTSPQLHKDTEKEDKKRRRLSGSEANQNLYIAIDPPPTPLTQPEAESPILCELTETLDNQGQLSVTRRSKSFSSSSNTLVNTNTSVSEAPSQTQQSNRPARTSLVSCPDPSQLLLRIKGSNINDKAALGEIYRKRLCKSSTSLATSRRSNRQSYTLLVDGSTNSLPKSASGLLLTDRMELIRDLPNSQNRGNSRGVSSSGSYHSHSPNPPHQVVLGSRNHANQQHRQIVHHTRTYAPPTPPVGGGALIHYHHHNQQVHPQQQQMQHQPQPVYHSQVRHHPTAQHHQSQPNYLQQQAHSQAQTQYYYTAPYPNNVRHSNQQPSQHHQSYQSIQIPSQNTHYELQSESVQKIIPQKQQYRHQPHQQQYHSSQHIQHQPTQQYQHHRPHRPRSYHLDDDDDELDLPLPPHPSHNTMPHIKKTVIASVVNKNETIRGPIVPPTPTSPTTTTAPHYHSNTVVTTISKPMDTNPTPTMVMRMMLENESNQIPPVTTSSFYGNRIDYPMDKEDRGSSCRDAPGSSLFSDSSSPLTTNDEGGVSGERDDSDGLPDFWGEEACQLCYPDTNGNVPLEVETALRLTWRSILGSRYDILVAHISKSPEVGGLGISLEGTIDVDEHGKEDQPHHYIRTIIPGGPVGQNGLLRKRDELLEVNGKKLYGKNYMDVVRILKTLPTHVRLVCARRRHDADSSSSAASSTASMSTVGSEAEFVDVEASDIGSTRSSIRTPFKCKSEDSLFIPHLPPPNITTMSQGTTRTGRSRSEEMITGVAIWAAEPLIIELYKSDHGLGFSIVDHEDPMNRADSVIVIKTLVPGGVAHQDGRIFPGDRLLFVNDRSVERTTLDKAVDVLKHAPKGRVILGIAKPIPLHHDGGGTVGTSSIRDGEITDLPESLSPDKSVRSVDRVPPAPAKLENRIVIKRHSGPFRIEVDPVSGGRHGCRIRQIADPHVRQDARLREGDYITSLGSMPMRHLNGQRARALIEAVPEDTHDIPISYIMGEDVQRHMDAYLLASPSSRGDEMDHSEEPQPVTHSPPPKVARTKSSSSLSSHKSHTLPTSQSTVSMSSDRSRPPLTRQGTLPMPSGEEGWAAPRVVVIKREPGTSLGISIVGCKVAGQENRNPDQQISDIFIKQVTPGSPADKCGLLRTGDRILEVNDVNLRQRTHDDAVDVIRSAESPVRFLVQSLAQPIEMTDVSSDAVKKSIEDSIPHSPEAPLSILHHQRSESPDPQRPDSSIAPHAAFDELVDKEEMERIERGNEEDLIRKLAKVSSTEDEESESEEEDKYGYTKKHLANRYADLPGKIERVTIVRSEFVGLGLHLAGNKDPHKMNVFVCRIKPGSPVEEDNLIQVGDELLEINGETLVGRSHLNSAPIIKRCQSDSLTITLVVHRHPDNIGQMAVPPGSGPMAKKSNSVSGTTPTSDVSKTDFSEFGEVFHITLVRSEHGLGFFIMDGSYNDESGIYIKQITPGGEADMEGTLRKDDRLLSVNGNTVVQLSYDATLELLRKPVDKVRLVVARPKRSANASIVNRRTSAAAPSSANGTPAPLISRSLTVPSKPSKDTNSSDRTSTSSKAPSVESEVSAKHQDLPPLPVDVTPEEEMIPTMPRRMLEPGKETEIEIFKPNGLGISIVGGSDTILGTVIVYEVYENGTAARDGRLQSGDRILAVDGVNLRDADHDYAIKVLRGTGKRVVLKMYRDKDTLQEEDLYDHVKVDLMKKTKKGLGISIISKRDVGVCISDMLKGGAAESDGRLKPGDIILEINGENVREAPQDQIATILKRITGKVSLLVGRPKQDQNMSTTSSQSGSSQTKEHKKSDQSIPSTSSTPTSWQVEKTPIGIDMSESSGSRHSSISDTNKTRRKKKLKPSPPRIHPPIHGPTWQVTLERDSTGLGLSIAGGPSSRLNTFHIVRVVPNSPAGRSAAVQAGDRLVAVNGELVDDFEHAEIIQKLRESVGRIELTLAQGLHEIKSTLELDRQ